MTHAREDIRRVQDLIARGLGDSAIARETQIARKTVSDWRHGRTPGGGPFLRTAFSDCSVCAGVPVDGGWYAYLLGMYLGDGWISAGPRGVYKLRVCLDIRYIGIIDECAESIRRVRALPQARVGFVHRPGCVDVLSYWKHWPCLFPQHGVGMKYLRPIHLEAWQRWIVLQHPERLLRGLIHSHGCRDLNMVKGKSYPRYSFSNNSNDIRQIFCDACDLLGIHWTSPFWKTISIARRSDVSTLDGFVGPKA
jgi:hypothetical protein